MKIINPLIYDKYLYEQIEAASLVERSSINSFKSKRIKGGSNILNETVQSYLSFNKKNTKS